MNGHPKTWAYEQDVRGLTKFVLCTLADYAGMKNKPPFPSYETLAAKCGISRSSVIRALSKLEEAKLVTKEKRFNKSNIYHLNMGSHADTGESHADTTEVPHRDSGSTTQTPKPTINQSTTNQLTKETDSGKGEEVEIQFPEALNTPDFKDAWLSYEQYRRETKLRPLPPSSVKAKLAELSEWGEEVAIEQIRQTIGNGWQGIFPPKSFSSMPRAAGAPEAMKGSAKNGSNGSTKKPPTMWILQKKQDAMDERLKELSNHRAEVAGGDYVWTNNDAKQEYFALRKNRAEINRQIMNL